MVFADSVNLARRLSSKNENDLVQENMMGKFVWIRTAACFLVHSWCRLSFVGSIIIEHLNSNLVLQCRTSCVHFFISLD
jgi:hypothetical protein